MVTAACSGHQVEEILGSVMLSSNTKCGLQVASISTSGPVDADPTSGDGLREEDDGM